MKNKILSFINNSFNWGYDQAGETIIHLSQDFRSIKGLWNWIFLALYVWICVYLVLKYAAICGNTVVTSTSAIVAIIFTNYVWSSYMEKKNINSTVTVSSFNSGGSNGISTTSSTSPTGNTTSGDDVQ
jgi:hypothetical protein